MRTTEVLAGLVMVAAAVVLFVLDQTVTAIALCAAASFLAAHRGRADSTDQPAGWRGFQSILTNIVLPCGLALEVIFLLAWVFVPETAEQLREPWIIYIALAITLVQTLFWHRNPRFAAEPGLRLMLTDAVLSAASILCWVGAMVLYGIAPLQVLGREVVALDAMHLVLIGVLLQMPILMLRRGVPSLLTYLENELPLTLERRGFARDAPIYYPVAATGTALALATLLWVWLRQYMGSPLDHPIAGLIIVTSLTALSFVLSVGFVSRFRTRSSLVAKRYDPEQRQLVVLASVSLTVVAILVSIAAWIFIAGQVLVAGYPMRHSEIRDILVLAILAATGPIGFHMHARSKRMDQLEDRLPDLLSDLAESTRSGLTLSNAVMQARTNDYGVLSVDVDIMARQLSWGFSFAEVFRRFGERRKSKLVQRIVRLAIEAAHSGGNTADVLAAAGRSTYELRAVEADRRSTMATQMIIIYVIYGVFLLVIAILSQQFIPPLVDATTKSTGTISLFGGGPSLAQLRGAYVDAILVQAVGSGIVAGVLQESRWTAGLRHVFLMTAIAWIVARLTIL